jgi:hypothetical protein
MSGKPPDEAVWTGSIKLTVKPSKISMFTRLFAMRGSSYAPTSCGKQIRLNFEGRAGQPGKTKG